MQVGNVKKLNIRELSIEQNRFIHFQLYELNNEQINTQTIFYKKEQKQQESIQCFSL